MTITRVGESAVLAVPVVAGGDIRRNRERQKKKDKSGFCDCCKMKYEDIDKVILFCLNL